MGCLSQLEPRGVLPVRPQSGTDSTANARKGRRVFSVRRHVTKNQPGVPQKPLEIPHNTLLAEREGREGKNCAQGGPRTMVSDQDSLAGTNLVEMHSRLVSVFPREVESPFVYALAGCGRRCVTLFSRGKGAFPVDTETMSSSFGTTVCNSTSVHCRVTTLAHAESSVLREAIGRVVVVSVLATVTPPAGSFGRSILSFLSIQRWEPRKKSTMDSASHSSAEVRLLSHLTLQSNRVV